MLQTLVEASSWLLRISEDFKYSVIVLREAKNVKYGHFMEPGRTMVITSEWVSAPEGSSPDIAVFKGKGEVEGVSTVSARITLTRYNLGDRSPAFQKTDARIDDHLRSQLLVLRGELGAK